MIRFALVCATFFAFPAYADKVIGIEDQESAPKPRKGKAKKQEQSQQEDEAPKGRSRGHWSGSGAIWPGVGSFSAQLTIGYSFNPYLGVDVSAHYLSFDRDGDSGTQYGPSVDFVVRGANPTIVTPFIGVGPGYEKWRRAEDDKMFDDGASLMANAFAGVSIGLTRHFAISLARRHETYLQRSPKRYGNHDKEEPKSSISNQIGFALTF